ncbi:MAG TPA: hypothetical protein VGL91_08665 [Acidobacteriota bacterium]|jgi:Spy/CpxP family protein refolding chaperone
MNVRQRAIAALVAVFLIGCAAGGGAAYLFLGKTRASENSRASRLAKLAEVLHLSQQQEAQLREIMAESRRRFDAARAETAPKFQAIRMETDKKIFAILNEEQKKKFEAFLKEMESRKKEHDHPR